MESTASVWRSRDFRLAWAGAFVNDSGDWMLSVALPVYVFTETGSGSATALLFICQLAISALFGPFGGSLVDRLNLRRTLIGTNLAQAVMLTPLLAVTPDRIWPAYLAVIGQSLLSQVNNPANGALLPRLVETGLLTKANAAFGASSSLARLVGAPVGGLLIALGGLFTVVVVDMISFLVAAAAIGLIRTPTPSLTKPQADPAESAGVRAGLREIARRPLLGRIIGILGLAQIAQGGFVVLFVVFVIDRLGRDGTEVGLIRGTMAIGAVLGAIIISRTAHMIRPVWLVAWGFLGMGVVSLVFWNAPIITQALWVYILLFALSGIPGSALSVGITTTVQTTSPPEVLGRVYGVLLAADAIGTATGSVITGFLIDVVPLTLLLDGQAAIYLLCGVLSIWLARSLVGSGPDSAREP